MGEPRGQCNGDSRILDAILETAVSPHVSAVRQYSQWDMLEFSLLLQEIRQHMVADFINILSMHMAYDIQVRRVNYQLAQFTSASGDHDRH